LMLDNDGDDTVVVGGIVYEDSSLVEYGIAKDPETKPGTCDDPGEGKRRR
jgi:hypothetical protein